MLHVCEEGTFGTFMNSIPPILDHDRRPAWALGATLLAVLVPYLQLAPVESWKPEVWGLMLVKIELDQISQYTH